MSKKDKKKRLERKEREIYEENNLRWECRRDGNVWEGRGVRCCLNEDWRRKERGKLSNKRKKDVDKKWKGWRCDGGIWKERNVGWKERDKRIYNWKRVKGFLEREKDRKNRYERLKKMRNGVRGLRSERRKNDRKRGKGSKCDDVRNRLWESGDGGWEDRNNGGMNRCSGEICEWEKEVRKENRWIKDNEVKDWRNVCEIKRLKRLCIWNGRRMRKGWEEEKGWGGMNYLIWGKWKEDGIEGDKVYRRKRIYKRL